MKAHEIEILLEKYLDAKTTLQEETILRDYFNNNEVEPHLLPYKAMFTYFTAKEEYEKPVFKPKKKVRWLHIAASVVLLMGLYFGYEAKQNYQTKIAYDQTESAINLLASNLNKGASSMGYLNEFNKTTNKIFKK